MNRLSFIRKFLQQFHPLCFFSVRLGFACMLAFYIIAVIARKMAPYAPDFFYAMSFYRGALEAAPACLAVGICCALLGDLMLKKNSMR